ncbi:hypothetical protein HZA98_04160 [Candidatus Woesearchaeota archaeon]|nr:hypothetical protein [Candidatus Woesearchaeota archaeon]
MSKTDEYKGISDSFETGFETYSDKELVHKYKSTNNECGRQDIALEMSRRLKQEVEEFNVGSSKQSEVMINLTRWIMWLTIVMGIFGLIQLAILIMQTFLTNNT